MLNLLEELTLYPQRTEGKQEVRRSVPVLFRASTHRPFTKAASKRGSSLIRVLCELLSRTSIMSRRETSSVCCSSFGVAAWSCSFIEVGRSGAM